MNLKLGGILAAAVMGVISEIGSQIVSQKWDEFAESRNLPRTIPFGRAKDDNKEEDETE